MATQKRSEQLLFFVVVMAAMNVSQSAFADDLKHKCDEDAAPPSANVEFPRDDGIVVDGNGMPTHMYEQWYWNAVLKDDDENLYGIDVIPIEFNFFGFLVQFVQVGFTNVSTGEYFNDYVVSYGTGYDVIPNGMDLDLHDPTTGAGLTALGGGGEDELELTFTDGTLIRLHFDGLKFITPGFFDGIANYLDPVTGESHGIQKFANRRNMKVTGEIFLPGECGIEVKGLGWYDKQWGSVIGTPGTDADNVNWKYAAFHIFDDTTEPNITGGAMAKASDYMLYDMYANDTGNNLLHVVNKVGPRPECEIELIQDFDIEGTGVTITESGETFDLINTVFIQDPAGDLELTFVPLVDGQFILTGGIFSPAYEGLMEVVGTRTIHHPADGNNPAYDEVISVSGYGYYEETNSCCQPPQ